VGKLDLALVKFTSSKNYPIAKIADSRTVREGSTVYYTGFPAEKANQPRNYRFIPAPITGRRQDKEGYELSYNGPPLQGMSGGPVLNEEGLLIAIHGKAETRPIIIEGIQRTEIVGVQGIPTEKFPNLISIIQNNTQNNTQANTTGNNPSPRTEPKPVTSKKSGISPKAEFGISESALARDGVQGIPTEKWPGYLIAQTFTEWCQQKASLPQETRRTVEALLQVAETQNCSQANQMLTNLTELSLGGNQISDIKPLSNLTNLTSLYLWENQISDIKPLSNLTNLTELSLGGNQISDIKPLSNLTNLTSLSLWKNQISDIKPLSNLTNLTSLSLWKNQISDIKPLSNLTNLTWLHLEENQISDIKPLSNLTNLTWLDLEENQISDIKPLSNLTKLTSLSLWENQISDIKPLSNLTKLTRLDLSGNKISDIKPLSNLTNLTVLWLEGNQISDIKPLSNLTNLTELSLTGNPLVSKQCPLQPESICKF
jgi:internalin A